MVKHLHMFKDVRSKAEHGNQINCECVLQCGQFRYRYYWDWAKFPMELQGCTVAGVACDSHNNVYAAVRAPGCPGIAKFAPDERSWDIMGKGFKKEGRMGSILIKKTISGLQMILVMWYINLIRKTRSCSLWECGDWVQIPV